MNYDEFANHDAHDLNDPSNHREATGSGSADGYDDAAGNGELTSTGSLEDILERHLSDVEAEHALLLSMWNATDAKNHSSDDAEGLSRPDAGSALQTTPGHVTVLHQARALTAGDLRAALIGLPDDQPVAIDVPLDPGGLVLHRYVLTSTAPTVLLLPDEEEVLDPSLVLRGDFPTGVYEIPTDDAPTSDPSPRTH